MVFIRAPKIERVGPGVEVIATEGNDPVAVRQGRVMAATFHPELSDDPRPPSIPGSVRDGHSLRQAQGRLCPSPLMLVRTSILIAAPKTGAQSGLRRYNNSRFRRAVQQVGAVLLPEKRIRFGDFQLDYGSYQLCRRGIPVRLEGLPLQLLMFLVDNRGQLVTRQQISTELWSSKDVFVDVEQGINTAIRKIRRALCDDAGEPLYLQTVVGRGYRFLPLPPRTTSTAPRQPRNLSSPPKTWAAPS